MSDTTDSTSDDQPSIWMRLIPMLILAACFAVAQYVLFVLAVIQFIWVAIDKEPNKNLTSFGDTLSRWLKQNGRFLSYATEDKPFPWTKWPDTEVEAEPEIKSEPVSQPEPAKAEPAKKSPAKPRATKAKAPAKPRAKPGPKPKAK